MKQIIIIICCVLLSCKPEKKNVAQHTKTQIQIQSDGCVLQQLPKAVNYKEELKKIEKVSQDTTIIAETIKHNNKTYKTVFQLIPTEYRVWLLKEDVKTDSILVHYQDFVEYMYEVESKYDLKNCEIEQVTSGFEETEVQKFKL